MAVIKKLQNRSYRMILMRIQDLIVPVSRKVEVVCLVVSGNDRCCDCLYITYPYRIYTYRISINQRGFQRQIRFIRNGNFFRIGTVPVK